MISFAVLLLFACYGLFNLLFNIWITLIGKNGSISTLFCYCKECNAEFAARRLISLSESESFDCFLVMDEKPGFDIGVKVLTVEELQDSLKNK